MHPATLLGGGQRNPKCSEVLGPYSPWLLLPDGRAAKRNPLISSQEVDGFIWPPERSARRHPDAPISCPAGWRTASHHLASSGHHGSALDDPWEGLATARKWPAEMTPAHPVCCWLRKISREITFENAPRREVSHAVVSPARTGVK